MLNCSKCNYQLDVDAMFCPNCGQAVEKVNPSESVKGVGDEFCAFCGNKKKADKLFCPNCGQSDQDSDISALPKSKKAYSLRNVIITIAVVVFFVVGFFVKNYLDNPFNQFKSDYNNGQYMKAINTYQQEIVGDTKSETDVKNFIKSNLADNLDLFIKDKISQENFEQLLLNATKIDNVLHIASETIYSIKSTYTEVKLSKEHFPKGMSQFDNKDYANAILSFNKVSDKDYQDYKIAQEKITSAKQLYKEDIIKTAQQNMDNGDYEKAIDLLNTALSTIPNDTELTTLMSSAFMSKVENTIDKYVKSGDLASALKAYNSFKGNENFSESAKLSTTITKYIADFRKGIIDESISAYKNDGIDSAIPIINEGLAILADDNLLNKYLSLYNSCVPVALNKLPLITSDNPQLFGDNYSDENITDAYGNSYSGYFDLCSYGTGLMNDEPKVAFNLYNTDGQYTNFCGTFFSNKKMDSRFTVIFEIFADGVLIYNSGYIKGIAKPEKFDIDITNVKEIKIQSRSSNYTSGGPNPRIFITESSVYRKLKDVDFEMIN